MKILIGYDGSESADTALADLRRAGLGTQINADHTDEISSCV